jgi:CheY-like chemotaxis protein
MKPYSSRILSPVTKRPEGGAVPIAQVAHGLNNTLTVITGFSELLLSVLSECDPHRRYVEEIQRAGQHAAELTRQLPTCAGTPSPPSAKAPRASWTLRELAHQHHGCETILLVEDDEAVRDALGHELILLGYTVLEAADGPEALRVAEAQPDRLIDLLLTDVVMPEMDGFTLAARLREKQPRLKVLFSSGYSRDMMLRPSPHPSSDGFLPKPYNAAALMRTIGEVLGEGPQAGPMERASHPVLSPPDSPATSSSRAAPG